MRSIVGEFAFEIRDYRALQRQARHCDKRARISMTLAGGCAEETDDQSVLVGPGDVIAKKNTAPHENRFGETGARIASVAFLDDAAFDRLCDGGAHWSFRRSAASLRDGLAMLDAARAGDAAGVRAGALDLLQPDVRRDTKRAPPRWLARLKDELEDRSLRDVDVAARAEEAGAHPAHAARLFRRHYGSSITEHGQHQSVRRALGAIWRGEPLGGVAFAAGFYDQSHMNRVFRRVAGRTPGDCRQLALRAG